VAIDEQGIGQTPSVHMVGFVAAGQFGSRCLLRAGGSKSWPYFIFPFAKRPFKISQQRE
jgi:hypothetical protein